MSMLTIKKISASVEDKEILHDISFAFVPGTTYAILGPNGSGKSTLGNTIMGHPDFTLTSGDILFGEISLKDLPPHERAKLGIFLSFQNPLPLPGVSVMDLFRMALVSSKKLDAMTLHKKVKAFAEELNIKDELLKRSLHEGFSGGEKKKIEVLQAALLEPKLAIFDEIDTGVDVDALKLITHSHKLLSILNPSTVLVLKNGHLIKTGDHTLAEEIEKNGFEQI